MATTSPVRGALSAIDAAPTWLNSDPLTAAQLSGRAVLVDFCTYTCVNWLRTLPYLRAWHARYREHGLAVIGVHSPEFGFEHDVDNVRRAARGLEVDYPLVLDNDFGIWRSFDNHYWPAVYVLDGDGQVRFQHFGEGGYEDTESAVQRLLGVQLPGAEVDAGGANEAADWDTLRSPETYLGRTRSERRTDALPGALALNDWALSGLWSSELQAAVLDAAAGSIAYRFQARDVNLVLAPPDTGSRAEFSVTLDGQAPGEDRGLDIDSAGNGVVRAPRMYQLIRQRGVTRPRTFEIEFVDPLVRAYVFTFG